MSRTGDEISWSDHTAWYSRLMQDATRVLLVAECDARLVGVVRFDQIVADEHSADSPAAEISINLAPAERGRGLAHPVLRAACQFGFDELQLAQILADIKPENAASIRAFEKVGFRLADEISSLRQYVLRPDWLCPT